METFLYIMAGFAIGYETGRRQRGEKCDWKKGLLAGGIALALGAALVFLLNYFRA